MSTNNPQIRLPNAGESQSQPSATGTQTVTSQGTAQPGPSGTLRLRGGTSEDRKVKWDEEVVDNEGLGRKKSKSVF